jgi:hypothetical protein
VRLGPGEQPSLPDLDDGFERPGGAALLDDLVGTRIIAAAHVVGQRLSESAVGVDAAGVADDLL